MEEIYTRLPLRCSIAGSTAFVSATCTGLTRRSVWVWVGVHAAHGQRMTDRRLGVRMRKLRIRCARYRPDVVDLHDALVDGYGRVLSPAATEAQRCVRNPLERTQTEAPSFWQGIMPA